MITAMMMMVAAGIGAPPAEDPRAAIHTVPVCLGHSFIPGRTLAKQMAAQIFATAHVRLEWHDGLGQRSCPAGAIQITVENASDPKRLPGSVAYALPFEGTHIHVFYDRLQAMALGQRRPHLLALVLVHEITHMLQGICRHSETGVMKAYWHEREYNEITIKPLTFTDADIELIQLGLAARAPTVAVNAAQKPLTRQ